MTVAAGDERVRGRVLPLLQRLSEPAGHVPQRVPVEGGLLYGMLGHAGQRLVERHQGMYRHISGEELG